MERERNENGEKEKAGEDVGEMDNLAEWKDVEFANEEEKEEDVEGYQVKRIHRYRIVERRGCGNDME